MGGSLTLGGRGGFKIRGGDYRALGNYVGVSQNRGLAVPYIRKPLVLHFKYSQKKKKNRNILFFPFATSGWGTSCSDEGLDG